MLSDFLKSKMFNVIFSFAIGVGLVAILRPVCTGDSCKITKAPTPSEWDGFVYRMGSKCYEYKSAIEECPKDSSAIESFTQCSMGKPRGTILVSDTSPRP